MFANHLHWHVSFCSILACVSVKEIGYLVINFDLWHSELAIVSRNQNPHFVLSIHAYSGPYDVVS